MCVIRAARGIVAWAAMTWYPRRSAIKQADLTSFTTLGAVNGPPVALGASGGSVVPQRECLSWFFLRPLTIHVYRGTIPKRMEVIQGELAGGFPRITC